jgi:DNA-directed RNA polymerase II subunit RPB7
VESVNPHGFFAVVGPLSLFVSAHVCALQRPLLFAGGARLTASQMMPPDVTYDANATPPQFTNNADVVIEPTTHIRARVIGMRTEVGEMWAIGSINGDFLG